MTELSSLLARKEQLLAQLRVKAPEPTRLMLAVAAVGGDSGEARKHESTPALQARIAVLAAADRCAELEPRELREACATFLSPPSPPGRDHSVGPRLLSEVGRRQRRPPLAALIDAYIGQFAMDDTDVAALADFLATTSANWRWATRDPWPEAAKRFHLFDVRRAPASLAEAVLLSDEPAAASLAPAGLTTDGRRRGGLALAAFQAACRAVSRTQGRVAVTTQERLTRWCCPDGRGRTLEFPQAWPDFARALFLPWQASPPIAAHERSLTELAINYAGDPRSETARWKLAPEARATLKKWLVRASVLQFFDIVDQVAAERMWRYRRAFWQSYVKANHVQDAWVVFGSAGAARARWAADRAGEPAMKQFGQLESGGGRGPAHACLLMRIGDLTIAEWSHNGRCYIWLKDTSERPSLGQKRYYADQLAHPLNLIERGLRIGIAHGQADTYGWQEKVARVLWEHAGVRTASRDWRP